MKKAVLWFLSLLFLLSTGSWAAQAPDLLRFSITSEENGKPVPNALVRLGGREAVAAADGQVSFPGVGNGQKRYTVIAENFEDATGTVTLADGHRPPVKVRMKPAHFVTWNGEVRAATGLASVVGARIVLTPKKQTRWQTMVQVNSDIDGKFSIPRLTGDYTVEVTATGFHPLRFDLPASQLARFRKLRIEPVVEKKTVRIQVRDCTSGKPLAGVRTVFFEAPEKGAFGQSTTDQSGTATVTVTPSGWTRSNRNWNNDQLQSRKVILRATLADAFTDIQADLSRDDTFSFCLDQNREVEEQEPNNNLNSAQKITLSDQVYFRINDNSDVDIFRFTLRFPASLKITTQYPNTELQAAVQTGDAQVIRSSHSYRNQKNVLNIVLAPGTYYYVVNEWGKNESSNEEGTITFSVQSLADAYEPNNSIANATAIDLPATIRAKISANGDQDNFIFQLDYPGLLRVRSPKRALELTALLMNENGETIGTANSYANTGLLKDFSLDAGTYVLRIQEWGNNGWNVEPYQLWVDFFPDDDNQTVHVDRTTGMAEAVIQHLGDHDAFEMSIPRPGHLRVRTYGRLERTVTISSAEGDVSVNAYNNTASTSTADFNSPGPALIKVREWGDNGWSSSPIMIETTFFPADLYDSTARNETMATATPFQIGEEVHFSINPLRDQDWFQTVVDQAGQLEIEVKNRVELSMELLDRNGQKLWSTNMYSNTGTKKQIDLQPGVYYLHFQEWGNNGRDIHEAFFRTRFTPADPAENRGWQNDPVRRLALGMALTLRSDSPKDQDDYVFQAAAKGEYRLHWRSPVSGWLIVDSGTGQPKKHYMYANSPGSIVYAMEAGQRLEIRFSANGQSAVTSGYLAITDRDVTNPPWASATTAGDPLTPTRITFTCSGQGTDRIEVLPQGAGGPSLACAAGGTVNYTYPRPGYYTAIVRGVRGGKRVSRLQTPVTAVGQPVLKGLHVALSSPLDGAVIDQDLNLQASAINYDGGAIKKVVFLINGKPVGTSYQPPYSLAVDRGLLRGTTIRIEAAAVDRNNKVVRSRPATVKLSPFFNLFPEDNATVTSAVTRFTWQSDDRRTPMIDYRPEGEEKWSSAAGTCLNGHCTVTVKDMQYRKVYEFRARFGQETSAIRRLTRIKGLSFTAPAYSANIRRDYDQSAVVTVQNAGDKPVVALLKCRKPDTRLLVSLVGDGSENHPVTLKPNERRSFKLGLSAQDVIRESHTVNVYIESKDGSRSDQAVLNVVVDLPEIKMNWKKLGPTEAGLGTRFTLHNNGDPITDLKVTASKGFTVSPEISHGFLPSGGSVDITVYPELSDGFTGISGQVTAQAISTRVSAPVEAKLKPGEKIFLASLIPGSSKEDELARLRAEIRAQAAAYLDPKSVDWTRPSNPVDTDLNGRPDQWTFPSPDETVRWTGHDTDGDAKVDFVTADVGGDSIIDYAAYRTDSGWEATNLVDAVLETKFSLPWARSAYHPHTVHLVYNDTVIGTIENRLPEGNFVFRIPQSAIRFDASGRPKPAELKVVTEHLPGGHYIVNNDYQLRARMTGVTAYAAGIDRKAAIESLRSYPGVSVTGPDYSVDTASLKVSRTSGLKPGDQVRLSTVIANYGASTTPSVDVALVRRSLSGGREREIQRQTIEIPSVTALVPVTFTWKATPGPAQLVIVVDPDKVSGDQSTDNNEAITVVEVSGQETDLPPFEPSVRRITANSQGPEQVFEITANGTTFSTASLIIDDNPTADLKAKGKKKLTVPVWLEPGTHQLRFQLTDGDGQQKTIDQSVTIQATPPKLVITKPKTTTVNQAKVVIRTSTDRKIAMAAVRVSGQPWKRMKMARGETKAELYLPYGKHTVEVMVVGKNGARTLKSITLVNQHRMTDEERQALERERQQALQAANDKNTPLDKRLYDKLRFDGRIPTKNGVIDAFKRPNQVMTPPPEPRRRAPHRRPGQKPGKQRPGKQPPAGTPAAPAGSGGTGTGGHGAPATAGGQGTPTPQSATGGGPVKQFAVEPEVKVPPPKPQPDPQAGQKPGAGGAAVTPWPDSSPSPSSGSAVTVTRKKHDWYCTNRPKIKNRFTLPDWLRRKKLPKPGTKEYERLMKKYLAELRRRGYDTRAIERFQQSLIRRISRMEQPGELPGFLESIGFTDPKPTDPKELARWRVKMKAATEAWWLRLLASGDPRLIKQGLKARARALSKFDQAAAEHAGAVIDTIQANQEFAENIIESIPVAGEILDVYAVTYGTTALSGRQVSDLERALRLLGVAGPAAIKAACAAKPYAKKAMTSMAHSLGEMGQAARKKLAATLGTSWEAIEGLFKASREVAEESAEQAIKRLDNQVDDALIAFKHSDEGKMAAKVHATDIKQARKKLTQLDQVAPDSKEFEELVLEIQKDKTAQALINKETKAATREGYNRVMKNIYDKTDEASAETLKKLATMSEDELAEEVSRLGIPPGGVKQFRKKVKEIAQKKGVNVKDLEIRGTDFSGNAIDQVGRDRDVTFKIFEKNNQNVADSLEKVVKVGDKDLAKEAAKHGIPVRDVKKFKQQLQDIAEKHGVDIDDLNISATGSGGQSVGKQAPFAIFDKNGRKLGEIQQDVAKEIADIHHDISKNIYEQNFWKETTGKPLPMKNGTVDMDLVSSHAEELDQAVTSKWHPEAYAIGRSNFNDFIKGKAPLTHVEAVADTVVYKGEHWFKRAAQATIPAQAAKETAEGMRQMTKQWRRLVEPKLEKYFGEAASTAVPAKLKKSLQIFQQVEDGVLSVAQAEHALSAIGMPKEKVLEHIRTFIVQTERTAGHTHRLIGARHLADAIGQIKAPPGSKTWLSEAYHKINSAFINGDISRSAFLQQRAAVAQKITGKTFASKQALEQWLKDMVADQIISPVEAKAMLKHW